MQEVSLKNILAEQKVAAAFVKKVLIQDNVINDFDIKTLFDPKSKLSKLPHDVKMNILKRWSYHMSWHNFWDNALENPFGDLNNPYNDINFQRHNFDQIIKNLPEEYRLDFDLHITDILCKRFVKTLADGENEVETSKNSLPYLDNQLKLSEEQNWPAEKKAVIQKWIAYCEEKIKPSQEFLDKKAKNGKFVDLYSYFLKDEKPLDLAQLEGILNAKFHDRSVVVKKSFFDIFFNPFKPIKKRVEDGEIEAKDQNNYEDIDYKTANLVIKKFCFDGVISSTEMSRDLYLGEGPFKYVPLENRLEIAATTSVLKTLADWYKFISQIKQDERNPKMDAAFLSSLPKEEFNKYNLLDVLDCIIGEKEIKIQVPFESEQTYSDEEENSLDTESDTESAEKIDENDIVYESCEKPNSIIKPDPVPFEKPEEEEEVNWFIRLICFIARVFGIRTALGYYTNTCKRIAPATPVYKDLKQIAAGKKKKELISVCTNTHTKPKSIAKGVKQVKNIIPKGMISEQKNITL